jgi:transcriptional regulator with XRE-family HTH domain
MSKVGLIIAQERTKKNMSKAKLAKLVGCTTRAIEYWESGNRSIGLDNANKVFNALGVTLKIGTGGIEI